MSKYLMSVLELYLKRGIRKCLKYRSFYFDHIFFRQALFTLLY